MSDKELTDEEILELLNKFEQVSSELKIKMKKIITSLEVIGEVELEELINVCEKEFKTKLSLSLCEKDKKQND